jgi:hypothetical protein
LSLPVDGSFTIKSEDTYYLSDIKTKIYELARAEFLDINTKGRLIFEGDLNKLSNKTGWESGGGNQDLYLNWSKF